MTATDAFAPFGFPAPFETARLRIRRMEETDVADIHAYDGREDVTWFLPYAAKSEAEVLAAIRRHRAQTGLAVDGDYLQLACERMSDGRVVGNVMLRLRDAANRCGEMGWVFHPDVAGQGYATEAADELLRRATRPRDADGVGLHRVVAILDPDNEASARLCERLRMRREAHRVEDVFMRGRWQSSLEYAVLAREVEAG